jgi:hypothetical protein
MIVTYNQSDKTNQKKEKENTLTMRAPPSQNKKF